MMPTPTPSGRTSPRRSHAPVQAGPAAIGFLALSLALALLGCAGPGASASPGASGSPGASPSPTPGGSPLPLVGLKYALVDGLGTPRFCDPDEYPVAHDDEATNAQARFPAIRADPATFAEIAARLKLDPAAATFTVDQQVLVYRDWKMLNALVLTDIGNGRRQFDYVVSSKADAAAGDHVFGSIDARGGIAVERREPAGPQNCPICLARGTLIATPDGPRPVESLAAGMPVWTVDLEGRRIATRIVRVGSTIVPPDHRVVRLRLSDGRSLLVSPGHPLLDGRTVGDLRPGDLLDGGRVVAADLVTYAGPATFDLLPAGPTGAYWADGILIASTLGP